MTKLCFQTSISSYISIYFVVVLSIVFSATTVAVAAALVSLTLKSVAISQQPMRLSKQVANCILSRLKLC